MMASSRARSLSMVARPIAISPSAANNVSASNGATAPEAYWSVPRAFNIGVYIAIGVVIQNTAGGAHNHDAQNEDNEKTLVRSTHCLQATAPIVSAKAIARCQSVCRAALTCRSYAAGWLTGARKRWRVQISWGGLYVTRGHCRSAPQRAINIQKKNRALGRAPTPCHIFLHRRANAGRLRLPSFQSSCVLFPL